MYDAPIEIIHHSALAFIPKNLSVYSEGNAVTITSTILPIIATLRKISTDLAIQITFTVGQTCAAIFEFALPKEYFSLARLNDDDGSKFLGIPNEFATERFMDILKIEPSNGGIEVEISKRIETKHVSMYFMARIYKEFVLSWGLDGKVIVWKKDTMNAKQCFVAQNPYLGGVQDAVADSNRR